MGDVATVMLAVDVVLDLIGLVTRFLERVTERQRDIRQNLVALNTQLGIIKDTVEMIGKRNYLRELSGVRGWINEAQSLINDTNMLLKRIEAKNNGSGSSQGNQEQFRCNDSDRKELGKLKNRCDELAKNNGNVLQLIQIEQNRRPFDWLLCGRCG